MQVAYTWSKSIDNASSFENILKPICDRCNRALSLFDARHRLVISYMWELPVPKYEGAKGKFLNGWAISGITSFQTGFPIRIQSSNDSELENSFDFELPGKPDLVAPFKTFNPKNNNNYYFDPNSFALPEQSDTSTPLQLLGNAPRTICCGPGINNFDFSVQKILPGRRKQTLRVPGRVLQHLQSHAIPQSRREHQRRGGFWPYHTRPRSAPCSVCIEVLLLAGKR